MAGYEGAMSIEDARLEDMRGVVRGGGPGFPGWSQDCARNSPTERGVGQRVDGHPWTFGGMDRPGTGGGQQGFYGVDLTPPGGNLQGGVPRGGVGDGYGEEAVHHTLRVDASFPQFDVNSQGCGAWGGGQPRRRSLEVQHTPYIAHQPRLSMADRQRGHPADNFDRQMTHLRRGQQPPCTPGNAPTGGRVDDLSRHGPWRPHRGIPGCGMECREATSEGGGSDASDNSAKTWRTSAGRVRGDGLPATAGMRVIMEESTRALVDGLDRASGTLARATTEGASMLSSQVGDIAQQIGAVAGAMQEGNAIMANLVAVMASRCTASLRPT
ncbi:hypothetical protein CBR_g55418 [Chara braunii]|uniref:Uncharacterized protein n=1 Tax=Chara braunii TaxID=69332 RepID=A0A388K7N5_CHABU|nr:hypothetical protein CBR_g55418 [Chara braunii]|eukprot:GBG66075.1 hypothetical protein CBR_g55418 [Chara braunii]